MTDYDILPFTNKIGQTVQPGDKVLVVTEGYSHRIFCREAEFLGTKSTAGTRNYQTVCRVKYVDHTWVDTDGNACSWNDPKKVGMGQVTRIRRMTYSSNRIFKLA
jgi:hypothetical protein